MIRSSHCRYFSRRSHATALRLSYAADVWPFIISRYAIFAAPK